MRALVLCALVLAASALPLPAQAPEGVPAPASHFGFTPGEDRRLADWHELTAYYEKVAAASPRVMLDTLGASTLGRPFVMLTVSSPANHAQLSELREIHLRLADPRRRGTPEELRRLKERARTVVLITSHIHSTEVGAGQMPANLLYRLASSEDEEVLEILDRVIILLIPSLNPDGTQLVAEWYREWLDTPYEGTPPVELYHPYVGHDNNRDWYAFTQVETQLTVREAHNAWRPMIVHDIHQMGATGARIFLPPYIDPFEPNVDPLIIAGINQLGSYMAAELIAQGKTGVVTSAQYDLFTPARAYQHYHGGVRILSETASARLATPITLRPEQLEARVGFDPRIASMNFPAPWPGGEWGMPQITDYMESGALALLRNAARNRRYWVDNFYEIHRRAVEGWDAWPAAWVIPAEQANQVGLEALLRILTFGSVEVHRAEAAFATAEGEVAAGAYVIPMNQPYASFAQTMLEVQDYPELREYAGGPPLHPYDVTAHTLPLLMSVEAFPVEEPIAAELSAPIPVPALSYRAPVGLRGPGAPRIGIYTGWRESIPSGWTRWLFDQHGIPYETLHAEEIRRGELHERFDVILFQDQPTAAILEGWRATQVPPAYAGGIGGEGSGALRDFVQRGGRVVAVEAATDFAIQTFGLGASNPLRELPTADFYVPGAILRLEVDTAGPLGRDAETVTGAWFGRNSRAFELDDTSARVIARYGADGPEAPRLSGWVLGGEHLAGQPALAAFDVGAGSIVLFGFQPNYRGQSIATWPLLFDALEVSRR